MGTLRAASSIILVSKARSMQLQISNKNSLLDILAVKRSQKSTNFPDAYAFPGGNVDIHDKSSKWLEILPDSEINVHLNCIDPFGEKINEPLDAGDIESAIFFRITAIRETFEECGILLCKNRNCTSADSNFVTHFDISDLKNWRQKIRNDATEFVNLCLTHDCYPDIGNLYFWSNWCTPHGFLRRYDTKFFLAILKSDKTIAEPDYEEIVELKWSSPEAYLQLDRDEIVFLAPPQFYEFHRLCNFQNFTQLHKYVQKIRQHSTCQQNLPLHVNVNDGMIGLLPGDEKYLDLLKMAGSYITDCDVNAYVCEKMHRLEYRKQGTKNNNYEKSVVIKNYRCPFNHILPGEIVRFPSSKM